MAISERIRFIRKKRNMTQKYVGMMLGFGEKNADSRIAQYENGRRAPREDVLQEIAKILGVSTDALDNPNLDTYNRLMHTLFAIEDVYGLTIDRINGQLCLVADENKPECFAKIFSRLNEWNEMKEKLKDGRIDETQYDSWRYNYPTRFVEIKPDNEIDKLLQDEFNK